MKGEIANPYLTADDLQERRVVFVNCENGQCGFLVEFQHQNCTFFYCTPHRRGMNVDLTTMPAAGFVCGEHGKSIERYDLLADDNVCPISQSSILAILSAAI
jgi:hypothetical protein